MYILYGDRLNLAIFINKMTKFSKLNLAWPSWLHSIPLLVGVMIIMLSRSAARMMAHDQHAYGRRIMQGRTARAR